MNLLKARTLLTETHIYNIVIPVINFYDVCTNKQQDSSTITSKTVENVNVYVVVYSRNV